MDAMSTAIVLLSSFDMVPKKGGSGHDECDVACPVVAASPEFSHPVEYRQGRIQLIAQISISWVAYTQPSWRFMIRKAIKNAQSLRQQLFEQKDS